MAEEPTSPNGSDQEGDVYPVLPPDPDLIDRKPALFAEEREEFPEAEPAPQPPFQFTMAEMLLLVALAATFLGILGLFPRRYAAGLAGLGAFVSMIVLAVLKPTRPIIYLAWGVLVGLYLLICVVAMIEGG